MSDARGLPVTLHLTPGQAHDDKTGQTLIGTLRPGLRLLADAAYDMNALRNVLAARGGRSPDQTSRAPQPDARLRQDSLSQAKSD